MEKATKTAAANVKMPGTEVTLTSIA